MGAQKNNLEMFNILKKRQCDHQHYVYGSEGRHLFLHKKRVRRRLKTDFEVERKLTLDNCLFLFSNRLLAKSEKCWG